MAHYVDGIVKDVEYRGVNSGLRKDGKTWMSLRTESLSADNARTWELNVPGDMQPDIMRLGLKRGDLINVVFTARAGVTQNGRSYDYLELERVPSILDVDEDGVLA